MASGKSAMPAMPIATKLCFPNHPSQSQMVIRRALWCCWVTARPEEGQDTYAFPDHPQSLWLIFQGPLGGLSFPCCPWSPSTHKSVWSGSVARECNLNPCFEENRATLFFLLHLHGSHQSGVGVSGSPSSRWKGCGSLHSLPVRSLTSALMLQASKVLWGENATKAPGGSPLRRSALPMLLLL